VAPRIDETLERDRALLDGGSSPAGHGQRPRRPATGVQQSKVPGQHPTLPPNPGSVIKEPAVVVEVADELGPAATRLLRRRISRRTRSYR
jgi:hypothetical protein